MAAVCSSACGHCGRCDDGVRDRPRARQFATCDTCGSDAIWPVTVAQVGTFCSAQCVDIGVNLALQTKRSA